MQQKQTKKQQKNNINRHLQVKDNLDLTRDINGLGKYRNDDIINNNNNIV